MDNPLNILDNYFRSIDQYDGYQIGYEDDLPGGFEFVEEVDFDKSRWGRWVQAIYSFGDQFIAALIYKPDNPESGHEEFAEVYEVTAETVETVRYTKVEQC